MRLIKKSNPEGHRYRRLSLQRSPTLTDLPADEYHESVRGPGSQECRQVGQEPSSSDEDQNLLSLRPHVHHLFPVIDQTGV